MNVTGSARAAKFVWRQAPRLNRDPFVIRLLHGHPGRAGIAHLAAADLGKMREGNGHLAIGDLVNEQINQDLARTDPRLGISVIEHLQIIGQLQGQGVIRTA